MLSTYLFSNLLSIILLIVLSLLSIDKIKPLLIRQLGLVLSIANLWWAIILYKDFDISYYGFQYSEINLGIDGIGLTFVLLTTILIPLAILSNWWLKQPIVFIILSILGLIITLNFIVLDQITFYVLFEASLIPLFLLIGLYGSTNRTTAAFYVLIYTLASSLFILLAICIYSVLVRTNDFITLSWLQFSVDAQCILWVLVFIGVAVKIPVLPVHTWLPIVHSESPLSGSILLAGVVLKLAIFAILRILLPTLDSASYMFTPIIFTLGIFSVIWTSLVTLRQSDLKVIIAYSSIGHIAICIISIFTNDIIGLNGGIILAVAHGLVSPALFICVGGILYDRYHNRLLWYYQGLSTYMPLFSIYLVVFSLCNTGTPLSGNFIGELICFIGSINKNLLVSTLAVSSVLLSACYQIRLTNRLTGGSKSSYLHITQDLTKREFLLLNCLMLPTIYLGIKPDFLINLLDSSVASLLLHL